MIIQLATWDTLALGAIIGAVAAVVCIGLAWFGGRWLN